MRELDLDAIERRFGADVPARREHDPACRDVLALTAEVRRLRRALYSARELALIQTGTKQFATKKAWLELLRRINGELADG